MAKQIQVTKAHQKYKLCTISSKGLGIISQDLCSHLGVINIGAEHTWGEGRRTILSPWKVVSGLELVEFFHCKISFSWKIMRVSEFLHVNDCKLEVTAFTQMQQKPISLGRLIYFHSYTDQGMLEGDMPKVQTNS